MSSLTADDDETHNPDASVLYSDEEMKLPITWDKNIASVHGTLHSVQRALRTQHPDLHRLIVTGTVEERGITYIDSPANIDFLRTATSRRTSNRTPC